MRTRPGAMSSSSWKTTTRSSGTLRKRTASPTALLDSFMKVIGFKAMVRSPPRWPSATSPLNRDRQGEKTRRRTISSTAMNPTLCRCPA
jgi:hypothetical protein